MREEYFSYKFSEDFHLLNHRKKLYYDIMETILSYLCFYPLLASIIYLINYSKDDVLDGLLLLIPLIIMTIIRKKTKSPIRFVLYTMLVIAAGVILLWTDRVVFLHSIFLLSYGVYSVLKRTKLKNNFWGFGSLGGMNIFLGIIYAFAILNKIVVLQKLIFIFAFLSLLIFIIYFHYSSGDKILQWEQYSDEEHIKHLKIINVMVSIIIIITMAVILYLSKNTGLMEKLDMLYSKICDAVLGAFKIAGMSPNEYMYGNEELQYTLSEEIPLDISGSSAFFDIFKLFMKIAFFVIIAVDIILIIFIVTQKLYSRYYRKLILGEEIESTLTKEQVSEKLSALKKPLKLLKKSVLKTNKEKLRKMYYQGIMEFKKNGVDVELWNTPLEIEKNINSIHNSLNIMEITSFYEKYRYSGDDPTKEDLSDMRKLLKKFKKHI